MLTKPSSCEPCPLYRLGTGFSLPSGPVSSRLLFVAEALGKEEVKAGEPLVGAAGGMHSRLCAEAGIVRLASRHDNVVRCQPPENWLEKAPWEAGAIDHCSSTYLADTLKRLPPKSAVVALGGVATRTLLRLRKERFSINNWHATVTYVPPGEGVGGSGDYFVIPTFHPSFLQRGATNLYWSAALAYMHAEEIARTGEWAGEPATLVIDPPAQWFTTWVNEVCDLLDQGHSIWCATDVETPDKATGKAEDELSFEEDRSYEITHYNFAIDPDEGVTVPNAPAYKAAIRKLMAHPRLVKIFWHATYDIPRMIAEQTPIAGLKEGKVWDGMWMWHVLSSDEPMSLGYVAPRFSRWGPWKHLFRSDFGTYRAVDAIQTLRIAYGVAEALQKEGRWSTFMRHVVEYDQKALWPAVSVGTLVDREALKQFKLTLEGHLVRFLNDLQTLAPEGKLTPKEGMREKPADGAIPPAAKEKKKGKGQTAKQQWVAGQAELVQREVARPIQVCLICGKQEVAKTHRCDRWTSDQYAYAKEVADLTNSPIPAGEWSGKKVRYYQPTAHVALVEATVTRWFWKEPFNADSPKQLLAAVIGKGHQPGKQRKTKKDTTDKQALEKLFAQTGDRFYEVVLDYRAVQKVLSNYVVGAERRLKAARGVKVDGFGQVLETILWRLHGEITHRPRTGRTSFVNPNLQNVTADRGAEVEGSGKSLASGFRGVIIALPAGVLPAWAITEEGAEWARRWNVG